jgi:hypothetical protein
VTDTTQSDRPSQPQSGLSGWLRARGRRILTLLVILAAIVGAYVLGLELVYRDLADSKQLVQQLQSESQKFKDQIVDQDTKLVALQGTVAKLQATLDALMPTKDTYQISANQSLIVANGRLTVGLVGAPTNLGIVVNINGKQHMAVSGDVIEAAVDPSTTCHVRIQAFDMFKAVITATCP